MKISEIIKVVGAKVLNSFEEDVDVNISTDTRTIQKNDFYLPLKGGQFDGEDFISQAFTNGAIGTFCTKEDIIKDTSYLGKCILQVPDTLQAYLKLANYRRNKLNPTVIAITGSSGKTTTKEIISSVLSEKYKTFKTPLNHNNEIGFCKTIFGMPDDTEVLVLEMGMRGLGEIELLSKYAEPDITVIVNVGTAHIGRLGSKENIAKAKCEIVKHQRGNLFIAHEDDLIKNTVNFNGEKIFYSIKNVKILEKTNNYSKFIYQNNIYELNVGGEYNIENSLSGIHAGMALKLTIEDVQNGLKKYKPIEKRWETVNANGFKIINDSYNANPDSMKAFIDTIFELYKNYTIILGDMGELGENEIEYHKEIGHYINNHQYLSKNTTIISIGNLSKNITDGIKNCQTKHFAEVFQATDFIKNNISKSSVLFLKASRSMQFEKIISLLSE